MAVDRFVDAIPVATTRSSYAETLAHLVAAAGPGHPVAALEPEQYAAATDTGPGWHLIADSDEFQVHPLPLTDQIAAAEADGRLVVGGVLLDRVTADGRLTGWPLTRPVARSPRRSVV
ncbi:hypothetical protein [Actinomadura violacea]|uniref:Uncharacterized protein n=1 Tax=Actinomadura violacea TaxID=2819934 RepID=A0ABS3RNN2_9ACTN|nr:hypothetical protein [Actinomadura violacea]MBO2458163.1 hypothetical protein [Actinomadura violacea]